jgi:hypothetical protein
LGHKYGGWVEVTAKALLWAVVFFALISMFQYIREFWSKLDSSIKYRERQRLAREQENEYEGRGKLARLHKQETELDPPASG